MVSEAFRLSLVHGLQLALGLVWVLAGVTKLWSPRATADAVRRLTGAPVSLAGPLAGVLPVSELLLSAALIADWHALAAALVSAALFTLFAVLVIIAAARDALGEGGCGCFGTHRPTSRPDHDAPRTVARNLILTALALAVASGVYHAHRAASATPAPPAVVASEPAQTASPQPQPASR